MISLVIGTVSKFFLAYLQLHYQLLRFSTTQKLLQRKEEEKQGKVSACMIFMRTAVLVLTVRSEYKKDHNQEFTDLHRQVQYN
jgi:hypothetical protein